jgi:hypothetical protein
VIEATVAGSDRGAVVRPPVAMQAANVRFRRVARAIDAPAVDVEAADRHGAPPAGVAASAERWFIGEPLGRKSAPPRVW